MSVPRRQPKAYPLTKRKPASAGTVRRVRNRAALYKAEDRATRDINRRLKKK